jgi:hypothetical protein
MDQAKVPEGLEGGEDLFLRQKERVELAGGFGEGCRETVGIGNKH